MRLHATAAFWALLASTAPRGLEAKGLRRKLLATNDCTIMAVEALGLEGNEDPEMIIECELSPEDADGISGISAPIDASPEQLRDLRKMIQTGEIHAGEDTLDIEGDEIDEVEKRVKIDPVSNIKAKVQKMPKDERKAKSNKDRRRRLVDTTGNLNMLLVKVTDSAGKTYPDSPAVMSDEVFGTENDPVNLKTNIEECSWGKATVVPGLGDPNEVATGVIEVTIDVPLDGSTSSTIRNKVTTAVQNKLGHSLPGPYDYVLYSLESCYGTDCNWAAYAYINHWNSVYQNVYYRRPGVLMHEIGHNFGLAHSGGLDGATYTDHTCTMGNPHYSDDGFQCFNPAKNFQLNWYDDAKITEDPRTSNYCKELTLVGIDEYNIRGGNPVTVRLETGTGADYFVGFNRASETGPNRLNDEGDNQVTIIQVDSGNGQSYAQSYLRAKLNQGQSHALSIGGKTVTITVNSIDITTTPGTASITISDGFICGSPPPPPTPSPTQAPCPSGQERYQVTVTTDNYGSETAYTLTNTCSNEVILEAGYTDHPAGNTEYPSAEVCADAGAYTFAITDGWGDGLCCNYGPGGYVVTADGVTMASGGQFTSGETKSWGTCAPTTPPTPPPVAPTNPPSNPPTSPPSNPPTTPPSSPPTANPTPNPTSPPSNPPTPPPVASPTNPPTPVPTALPTNPPPTPSPTVPPTSAPTEQPTPVPTVPPTVPPTPVPTSSPTNQPTPLPTTPPSSPPTANPTPNPTPQPSNPPTPAPSSPPTAQPTPIPTSPPTPQPSNQPTVPPTPSPTVPPTPAPTSLAREAVFDSVYGVPRCADEGMSCDSKDLLDGKGTGNNGPEPNSSNTNKFGQACNDGNSGTYHSDESIDQITVTAGDLDGSGNLVPSGDFIMEGGRAVLEAKVWCWSTGASDFADIYLASDAASPDWQFLATIQCPGGGEQTIKQAFDVPSGSNQSIRVNFRYNGSRSTCSSGSYDDHDELMFTVKANPNITPAPTPSPVASPPSGPSGPQTASHDAALGAPKCSYGSSCDSAGLLNGRASISGGIEPNRPNTLNAACVDGAYGSYHNDESIDKIVVTRADGGDGDLTEGDEVTLSANIWCWSTGSNDFIDFYYASNANSPVWTQIGTRQTCPGGGAQTVSANFVLPSGGLQAVRANLMYGSGTPGTNKCTSGNYDDTDDLVISVKPNALVASIAASSSKHDDVQGAVEVVEKDKNAVKDDEAKKELKDLNKSTEKPKGNDKDKKKDKDKKDKNKNKNKNKKAKIDVDDGGARVGSVSGDSMYVCSKHRPLDETICEDGDEADDTCSYEGQKCGKNDKNTCWFAACDGDEEVSE